MPPPPRVSPPRVPPPRVSPPRVSPLRVSPPRVSPPRVSPPHVSPPGAPFPSPPFRDVHGCSLTGSIPATVGRLASLMFFLVNQNGLSGSIPSTVSALQQLYMWDIMDNRIEGTPHESQTAHLTAGSHQLAAQATCERRHTAEHVYWSNNVLPSLATTWFLPKLMDLKTPTSSTSTWPITSSASSFPKRSQLQSLQQDDGRHSGHVRLDEPGGALPLRQRFHCRATPPAQPNQRHSAALRQRAMQALLSGDLPAVLAAAGTQAPLFRSTRECTCVSPLRADLGLYLTDLVVFSTELVRHLEEKLVSELSGRARINITRNQVQVTGISSRASLASLASTFASDHTTHESTLIITALFFPPAADDSWLPRDTPRAIRTALSTREPSLRANVDEFGSYRIEAFYGPAPVFLLSTLPPIHTPLYGPRLSRAATSGLSIAFTPSGQPASSGLSTGAIVGIAVGCATVVISLVLVLLLRPWEKRGWTQADYKDLAGINLRQARRYSLEELQRATDNFDNRHVLWEGGFGKVRVGEGGFGKVQVGEGGFGKVRVGEGGFGKVRVGEGGFGKVRVGEGGFGKVRVGEGGFGKVRVGEGGFGKVRVGEGGFGKPFLPADFSPPSPFPPMSASVSQGSEGKVYKGVLNGEEVAIKMATKQHQHGGVQFKNEIETLTAASHSNLVRLTGFCVERDEQLLVFEYIEGGALNKWIMGKQGRRLTWQEWIHIAQNVASALRYLHRNMEPAIIHGDIKPENILLTAGQPMQAKVADFGTSKTLPEHGELEFGTGDTVIMTKGYFDLDYMHSGKLTEYSDVYSFGVVLLQLATGKQALITSGHEIVPLRQHVLNLAFGLDGLSAVVDPCLLGAGQIVAGLQATFSTFLHLALWCTEEHPKRRPNMVDVESALRDIEAAAAAAAAADAGGFQAVHQHHGLARGANGLAPQRGPGLVAGVHPPPSSAAQGGAAAMGNRSAGGLPAAAGGLTAEQEETEAMTGPCAR
ncbi:unnamed protein product [Closterium sp. Yama58-4]|nr:unnamed protein product [Closterium sp. Yama58-4]